ANIKNPTPDFDVTVPDLDVEQVSTLFASGGGGAGKGGPAAGGRIGARRLLGKGALRIGRLRARPVEASAATARMNVFTDTVAIDSYTASVYGGIARGAMNIDYSAPRLPLQATAQVSGVDFTRFM